MPGKTQQRIVYGTVQKCGCRQRLLRSKARSRCTEVLPGKIVRNGFVLTGMSVGNILTA